jgi:hypothetical protein
MFSGGVLRRGGRYHACRRSSRQLDCCALGQHHLVVCESSKKKTTRKGCSRWADGPRIFKNDAQGVFYTALAVWDKAAEPPLSPNQRCAASRLLPGAAICNSAIVRLLPKCTTFLHPSIPPSLHRMEGSIPRQRARGGEGDTRAHPHAMLVVENRADGVDQGPPGVYPLAPSAEAAQQIPRAMARLPRQPLALLLLPPQEAHLVASAHRAWVLLLLVRWRRRFGARLREHLELAPCSRRARHRPLPRLPRMRRRNVACRSTRRPQQPKPQPRLRRRSPFACCSTFSRLMKIVFLSFILNLT